MNINLSKVRSLAQKDREIYKVSKSTDDKNELLTNSIEIAESSDTKSIGGSYTKLVASVGSDGNISEYFSINGAKSITLPNLLSNFNAIKIEDDSHKLVMLPVCNSSTVIEAKRKFNTNNTLIYNSFNGSDDLEYVITNKGIKENIIINKQQSTYEYVFDFTLENLQIKEVDGKVTFRDSLSKKIFYVLGDLYLLDSEGNRCNDIEVIYNSSYSSNIRIKIKPSVEWLNNSARKFPVLLDPSIEDYEESTISVEYTSPTNKTILSKYVGFKSNVEQQLVVSLNPQKIIESINQRNVNTYECYLQFDMESSSFPSGYTITCNYEDESGTNLPIKNVNKIISINISDLIKLYSSETNKNIRICLTQGSTEVSVSTDSGYIYVDKLLDTYFTIKNDKLRIYIEYTSFDEKDDDEIEYQFKNDGSIYVDGQNGHIKGIFPICNIGIKKFTTSLSLIHSSRDSLIKDTFLPDYLTTNFHKKLETIDTNLTNLEFIHDYYLYDGTGNKQCFKSKFYYLDGQEKSYVNRKYVYLDEDFTFKYKKDNEELQVYLETSNSYGTNLYPGSILSLENYGYFTKTKRYYRKNVNNGENVYLDFVKDADEKNGIIKFNFTISEYYENDLSLTKIYLDDDNSFCVSEKAISSSPKSYKVVLDGSENNQFSISLPIRYKEDGKLYIKYPSQFYVMSQTGTDADGSGLRYLYSNECDEECEIFVENDLVTFNSYINDLLYINDDLLNVISKIHEYESTINSIKNNLTSLSESHFYACQSCSSGHIAYSEANNMDIKSLFGFDFNNKYSKKSINDIENSICEYNKQLASYELTLSSLKSKLDLLIESQKENVNDYIVDSEGNILGFNGYGSLVLIADKNDNTININYDNDNENYNKILSIETDEQKKKFIYQSNILSNIIDPCGRKFDLICNTSNSIKLTKPDGCFVNITRNEDTITYESELTERYVIKNENNVISVNKEISNSIVNNNGLNNSDNSYKNVFNNIIDGLTGNESHYDFDKEYNCYFGYNGTLLSRDNRTDYIFENYLYQSNRLVQYIKHFTNGYSKSISYTSRVKDHYIYFSDTETTGKILKSSIKNNAILLKANFFDYDESNVSDMNFVADVSIVYNDKTIKKFNYEFELDRYKHIYLAIPVDNTNISYLYLKFTNSNQGMTLYPSEFIVYEADDYNFNIYNDYGYVAKSYSPDGITEYLYDNDNNVTCSTKCDYKNFKCVTTYGYDVNGNTLKVKNDNYYNDVLYNSTVNEYSYDENNNCIEEISYNSEDPSLKTIDKKEYDESGNVTIQKGKIYDTKFKINDSKFTYKPISNLLIKEENENGQTIVYSYDSESQNMRSISTSVNGTNNVNNIGYKFGLQTKVNHKGFATYFDYDCYGRIVNVKYNDTQMLSKTYVDKYTDETLGITDGSKTTLSFNNSLEKTTFSNKDGNVIKETINGDTNVTLNNIYSDDLLIKTEISSVMNDNTYTEIYKYQYDDEDRLISSTKELGTNLVKKIENTYDEFERVLSQNLTILDTSFVVNYSYVNPLESLVNTVNVINSNNESVYSVNYEYDALDRVVVNELKFNDNSLRNDFTYLTQDENTIDVIVDNIVSLGNNTLDHTSYIYDTGKRIIDISNDDNHTSYEYDNAGRIIRENNEYFNKTVTIKYDCNGNVISKKEYEYTLDTELANGTKHSFTYNLSGWSDQLLKYDGKSFQYDEMGNPILYKDLKLTWNKEGTLKSFSDYSYIYDANKVRIIKKSNDDSYKEVYVTDGTKILRCKIFINNKEKYSFDYLWNVDNLVGFIYNNAKYFFVKNIQGDITNILNQDGEIVAKYIYDAFGNHKVLDSEGNIDTNQYSLGNLNPYRYRGYYFDSETGLYYLQSRYYDPELGRFISPDSVEYLDASSINGLNLYAYCLNDPINLSDSDGNSPKWWQWALGACMTGLGILLCATGVGTTFGAGLIVGGISSLASSITSACGGNSKICSIVSSAINIVGGIALCCVGLGSVGAGMIGSGAGGIAGGFIGEGLGYSFDSGALVGSIVGSIIGGTIYKLYDSYKISEIARQGSVVIGEKQTRCTDMAIKCGAGEFHTSKMSNFFYSKLKMTKFAEWITMNNNKTWITRVCKSGVNIIDIGLNLEQTVRSPYYEMEILTIIKYLF